MEPKSVLFILLFFASVITLVIWLGRGMLRKRGRALDYDSLAAYLNAVPATDAQKLDSVDLALKGGVITLLGVLFPPLLFVGLVPLYYGLRKITMTLMGLGLTDSPIS
jgi:hypothetical protein